LAGTPEYSYNALLGLGGGGISNGATLVLNSSAVTGNSALPSGNGGGIKNNGTLTGTSIKLSGNTAGHSGGGIANYLLATLSHSTVSYNVWNLGTAGGIYNLGTFTLNLTKVLHNKLPQCGGVPTVPAC